jgi:hypothetical protein
MGRLQQGSKEARKYLLPHGRIVTPESVPDARMQPPIAIIRTTDGTERVQARGGRHGQRQEHAGRSERVC